MKHNKKNTGFTLIELLVVISIIAVLMSILMPALGKAKEQARTVLCSANIRQLTMGMLMYAEENDGKAPHVGAWIVSEEKFWIHLIAPYLGESRDFAKNMQDDSVNESLSEKALAVVRCPSTKDRSGETPNVWGGVKWFNGSSKKMWRWGGVQGSYGINGWFYGQYVSWDGSRAWGKINNAKANTPLFSDCTAMSSAPYNATDIPPLDIDDPEDGTMMGMNRYCMSRHNRKTNIGFVGGHVERVPIEDLWSLKWHKQSKPNKMVVFPNW